MLKVTVITCVTLSDATGLWTLTAGPSPAPVDANVAASSTATPEAEGDLRAAAFLCTEIFLRAFGILGAAGAAELSC